MKKESLKKMLGLPMLIVGSIILVLSTIVLLTTIIGSHSTGTYKYAGKVKEKNYEIEITLENDGTGLVEALVDYNSKTKTTEIERFEMRYKVYEDDLYIGKEYYGYTSYEKVGKITQFQLELEESVYGQEFTLKNNGAIARLVVSIVFMAISIAMLFVGVITITSSKKLVKFEDYEDRDMNTYQDEENE